MLGDAASREGWPDYQHFTEDPIFHFAMPWASWGDAEAARLAKVNSEVDAELLLETVGDAKYGFREGVLPNRECLTRVVFDAYDLGGDFWEEMVGGLVLIAHVCVISVEFVLIAHVCVIA